MDNHIYKTTSWLTCPGNFKLYFCKDQETNESKTTEISKKLINKELSVTIAALPGTQPR